GIAIPKQTVGSELQPGGKRISLSLPVLQLCDSAVLGNGNQESAAVPFDQRVDSVCRVRHRIELRWARLPSPQAGHPPAQRLPPPSSYREVTPEPKRPSSP